MATNSVGLEVPSGADAFDPQGDMVDLADSLAGRIIVPVPNETARTALVSALGWTPSTTRPLYVHRADAPGVSALEVTTNGTSFASVSGTQFLTATATGATIGSGGGTTGITSAVSVAAAPYPRVVRLDFAGMPSALSSGSCDIIVRRGSTPLKRARTGTANVTAGGSHTETLAAGTSASYQVVATTTAAATITNNAEFTYLTVTITPA